MEQLTNIIIDLAILECKSNKAYVLTHIHTCILKVYCIILRQIVLIHKQNVIKNIKNKLKKYLHTISTYY